MGERIRGSDLSEDVVLIMGGLTDMEVKAEVGEHEVVGIHEGDEATIEKRAVVTDNPVDAFIPMSTYEVLRALYREAPKG